MTSDSLRIDFPGLEGPEKKKPQGRKRRILRPLGLLGAGATLLVLPFFLLVRLSVYLLHRYDFGSWAALTTAALATGILLILYLVGVSLKFGGKGRVPGFLRKGVLGLVLAYCVYALLFISPGNVKSPDVRATFTALNPILRVGISTLLLVDREAVLTDAVRIAEDYSAWGLEVNEASLHLKQPDGFAYAVDLRTRGRPEWRNGLVEIGLRVMGFRTLRHVGTADHLHVSLAPGRGVRE